MFNRRSRLVFFCLLMGCSARAGELCEATVAALSGDLGASLRLRLDQLETSRDAQSRRRGEILTRIAKTDDQVRELQSYMGFRDKYLAGALGGDKDLVRRVAVRTRMSERRNEKVTGKANKIEALEDQMQRELSEWLVAHDEAFAALRQERAIYRRVVCATEKCLRKADDAQSAVSNAQSMETYDAVSSSTVISILSHGATSDASDEIDELKGSIRELNEALGALQDTFKAGEVDNVSDGLDLVFDMTSGGGGFDFMSWMNLSALSDAEDSIDGVDRALRQLHSKIDPQYNKLDASVERFLREARGICDAK